MPYLACTDDTSRGGGLFAEGGPRVCSEQKRGLGPSQEPGVWPGGWRRRWDDCAGLRVRDERTVLGREARGAPSATLHLSSLGDPTWQSRSARFTDEETETRRGEGPCPRPRKSWNLNTDISMPFNMPCVLFQRMGNGNQVTPNQHDADD